MKRYILLLTFFLYTSIGVLYSQEIPGKAWHSVDLRNQTLNKQASRATEAIDAAYFKLNPSLIHGIINHVASTYHDAITISLPVKADRKETIHFKAYNTMHPLLGKKYPYIRTYRGETPDGKMAYLTLSPLGLHAYVHTAEGLVFIEPLSTTNQALYRRYKIEDIKHPEEMISCGVHDSTQESTFLTADLADVRGDKAVIRKYRTAIIATEAYASFFQHDFDRTFSAVVDLVNGLNAIYIPVLGIQYEMIPQSDSLVFTTKADDPYGDNNRNGDQLLRTNTAVLYDLIGKDAFDVGHVLSRSCSDRFAGVSLSRIVCNNRKKGGGVSCNGSAGAFLFTTAHEFGHHLSAGHTFSNCPPYEDQLSSLTAVEPGSGLTFMSYAGACGDQNLGIPRQDFFHVFSLQQIINFSREDIGSTCGELIEMDNHLPEIEINAPSGLYIPISTFFELRGQGQDADGDKLLYNWEQLNRGPVSDVGNPRGNAPSFISQFPQSKPYRHFPKLNYALGHIFNRLEVLPDHTRDLNFRLTARDGKAGRAVWKEIEFYATEKAGPFKVTQPGENAPDHIAGQKLHVEWDVANTDKEPVSCERVDVYYSTDGGYTFKYLVAEGIPNDGSADVLIPGIPTDNGRIKIKASDNVFFDYSHETFTVVEPSEPTYALTYSPYYKKLCTPTTYTVDIGTEALLDYSGDITFSMVEDLPDDIQVEFSANPIAAGDSAVMTIDLMNFEGNGVFTYHVQAASESDTTIFEISFETTGTFFNEFALLLPEDGATDVDQATAFDWVEDDDAEEYLFQISDSPDFSSLFTSKTVRGSEIQLATLLPKGSVFYWRVRPENICAEGEWSETRIFKTVQQACTSINSGKDDIFIPGQGTPTVKSPLDVELSGAAIDVNVPNITGQHSYVGQLTVSLESPKGSKVVLWDRKCANSTDFNLGFDDGTSLQLGCPLTTGNIYAAEGDLSDFNGEDVNGTWNLIIKDHKSGSFGILNSWEIEVCFESHEIPPHFYRLDTMRIKFNTERSIYTALRMSHPDYAPWEISFHPIELPQHGTLLKIDEEGNEVELTVHDKFTMQDVYEDKVLIRHNGGTEVYDSLRFYAITNGGGWTSARTLPIKYQNEVTSSQASELSQLSIQAWPSPAEDILHLQMKGKSMQGEWHLYNMYGERVNTIKTQDSAYEQTMDVSNCVPGVYLLRWQSADGTVSQELMIQ